jgi:hypothetical protein
MKVINVISDGRSPYLQAQDEAIKAGFNCYSKPSGPDYWDYVMDDREGYYFSWHGKILEVVVLYKEQQGTKIEAVSLIQDCRLPEIDV